MNDKNQKIQSQIEDITKKYHTIYHSCGETVATTVSRINSNPDEALDILEQLEKQGVDILKPNKRQLTPLGQVFYNCILEKAGLCHKSPFLTPLYGALTYIGEKSDRLIEVFKKKNVRLSGRDTIQALTEPNNIFRNCPRSVIFKLWYKFYKADLLNIAATDEKGNNLWHIYSIGYSQEKGYNLLGDFLAHIPTEKSLVNAVNHAGDTPLLLAARLQDVNKKLKPESDMRSTDLEINTLIKLGADLKAQDKEGNTVLHLLAQKGNLRMTALLLQLDSHLADIPNNKGKKPADVAAEITQPLFMKNKSPKSMAQYIKKISRQDATLFIWWLKSFQPPRKIAHHQTVFPISKVSERQII